MASQPQPFTAASVRPAEFVDSVNPATGAVVERIAATPTSALPNIFKRAREAHAAWAEQPLRQRTRMLRRLRDAIYEARDEIVDLISSRCDL